ncbi:MAG: hypothetical protein Q8O42_09725 [Acidobacteriota bacterium]|nr:hypothetical protein [Acidobacteriota bacterium]
MGRRKNRSNDNDQVDRKSAGAGESADTGAGGEVDEYVFDGPFDADKAVEHLLELNHAFQHADRKWELAKGKASEAKSERDNASNAISLLLDRIDRHKNGLEDDQPVLKTIPGSTEGSVN